MHSNAVPSKHRPGSQASQNRISVAKCVRSLRSPPQEVQHHDLQGGRQQFIVSMGAGLANMQLKISKGCTSIVSVYMCIVKLFKILTRKPGVSRANSVSNRLLFGCVDDTRPAGRKTRVVDSTMCGRAPRSEVRLLLA